MSVGGFYSSKSPGPNRSGPRHHLTRSITESASLPTGSRLFAQEQQQKHHPQPQQTLFQPPHAPVLQRDRKNDDRDTLSAHPPANVSMARASFDLSRSEGLAPSPTWSPSHSRRASLLLTDERTMAAPQNHAGPKPARLPKVPGEKDKAASRLTGLRKSLLDLNSFATATTQRLDNAYYSVLEKTSVIQTTIAALKELAELSLGVHRTFEHEAAVLARDVHVQLDSMGNFDHQLERIEALQARIRTGRAKIERFSERADAVRETVLRWERKDNEWKERTRRRLKVIWSITLAVSFVVLALVLGTQHLGPSDGDEPPPAGGNGVMRTFEEL